MRRKDREMDLEFGYDLIDKASYGVLSIMDEKDEAYGVPLSLVRKEDILYFHSAKEGKKVDIFEKKTNVWVTFVGQTNIPENYSKEELEEISKDESKVRLLLSNVFTTEFESAMVKGKIDLVKDKDEKIEALNLICKKYTPDKMKYAINAINSSFEKVNIYRIQIKELSSKRKKYDSQGKEMKWGRWTDEKDNI